MPYAGTVRHQQNVVIDALRSLGAIDADHAVPLEALPVAVATEGRVRAKVVKRFIQLGILVGKEGGGFHLDDAAASSLLEHRGPLRLWRMGKPD